MWVWQRTQASPENIWASFELMAHNLLGVGRFALLSSALAYFLSCIRFCILAFILAVFRPLVFEANARNCTQPHATARNYDTARARASCVHTDILAPLHLYSTRTGGWTWTPLRRTPYLAACLASASSCSGVLPVVLPKSDMISLGCFSPAMID